MRPLTHPTRFLADEARALLTRLDRVRPFALSETMVPAAAVSVPAQAAIERYLIAGRRALRARIVDFLHWVSSRPARVISAETAHRRFAFLRLRFNAVLSQLDVFSEVMTQRSEHETGVLLSGLDMLAADALAVPGAPYEAPPVICYLQRGHGAAIRRARTRLPGGGATPVAIISVPRERMLGSALASSLVHEVGHQGMALLDVAASLRAALGGFASRRGPERFAWDVWGRWISEILADLWSVARVGPGATMGLMGVVALPRVFVFRVDVQDPHPMPYLRVKLSCAMGRALYPHAVWDQLESLWSSFYPTRELEAGRRALIALFEDTIPALVRTLLAHRPPRLYGRSISELLRAEDRHPVRLTALFRSWHGAPRAMRDAPPTLLFGALSVARLNGELSPETEGRLLSHLLTQWALRSALDTNDICASMRAAKQMAVAS